MRIQTKLTLLILLLSVAILIGVGIFSSISVDNYLRNQLIHDLTVQANQVEFTIRTFPDADSAHYLHLQELAKTGNIRLTLIDASGNVRFESERSQSNLNGIENHLHRPEVQEAISNGMGTNTRLSATINIEMLYLAKHIVEPFPEQTGFSDVRIVRVSIPLTQEKNVIQGLQTTIFFVSLLLLGLISVATILFARSFAKPISDIAIIAEQIREGNFEKRIPVHSSDEVGKLSENLNSMIDKLNEDITILKKLEMVRSEFLGNVSHELRTPIFAVEGLLETLLNGALEDKEVSRNFVERA